jgi:hypothetical protein
MIHFGEGGDAIGDRYSAAAAKRIRSVGIASVLRRCGQWRPRLSAVHVAAKLNLNPERASLTATKLQLVTGRRWFGFNDHGGCRATNPARCIATDGA